MWPSVGVVPYRGIGLMAANYLEKDLEIPFVSTHKLKRRDYSQIIFKHFCIKNTSSLFFTILLT